MTTPTKKPGLPDTETMLEDEIDELSEDFADDEAARTRGEAETPLLAQNAQLTEQLADLERRLQAADDARLRALADYQNLQRRSQSDRAQWTKLATQGLIAAILEPLEHLLLAAEQLNDHGLTMVVKQLFDRLDSEGLKKIDVLKKSFDPQTMEAVEGSDPAGKKVTAVVRNGYTLHGVLIQPAKVKVS